MYGRCVVETEAIFVRPLWSPDAGLGAVSLPPVRGAAAAEIDGGVSATGGEPARPDPSPDPPPPRAAGDADCDEDCNVCASMGRCAECQSSADCTDPGHAHCDLSRGQCAPCIAPEDCEGVMAPDRPLRACDIGTGQCVECTGSDYRACGVDLESFTPLVCDSRTRTCSQLREAGSHVCDACLSDAQCQPGQRCVPELFGGKMLGYICLWVPGSAVREAPGDCLNQGRPYVDLREKMESIDGEQVDVCALRTTTCKGLSEHAARVRACGSERDDDACGHPDLEDARCQSPEGSTAFRCVSRCGSTDDCKRGFACNTADYPSHCAVQPESCFADTDCAAEQQCVQQRCRSHGAEGAF